MELTNSELDFEYDERSLLSCLLFSEIKKDRLKEVCDCLEPRMFLSRCEKAIYTNIKSMVDKNDDVLAGSKAFVHKLKLLTEIELDDDMYIDRLETYWTPSGTINNWVKRVQDRYFTERFKKASSREEFEEVIEEQQKYSITQDLNSISENSEDVLKVYEQKMCSAITTPYQNLNNVIGSLQGGDMVILAGGTGSGKTAFTLNLAVGIAKLGYKVDIFSLEMPKYQVQQRIVCSEAKIDGNKFRSFTLTEEDKRKYYDYVNGPMKQLSINIYKKQIVSMQTIKNLEMKSDSDIIFIDYLGLIDSYNNNGSYERYSEISRQIKLLAMTCNKPIVALHQLNRSFQDRDDKTPKLSDIRDSGKIEQDADMVWFVHRPGTYDGKTDESVMKLIIAKNRHGANNKHLNFVFDGQHQRVVEDIRELAVC